MSYWKFRHGRIIIDQIFTLKELKAESYEHRLTTLVLFITFKQAYDRQGDPLSAMLFSLCLENKIREANINREQKL